MKINKILNLSGLALAAVMLPACSSDYLNEKPETDVSDAQISETLNTAQMLINGISAAMNTQYQSTEINQMNGEGYVNTNFVDGFGPDCITAIVNNWSREMYNWNEFDNQSAIANSTPWMYCYNLINQANLALSAVEGFEGDENGVNYIKAQALTFRAHAYIRLVQLYGPRWEDSNNGAVNCVVLRLKPGTGPQGFATTGQVLDQIYADLDEAIGYFDSCGKNRSYKWQVNGAVARGLYSRAALIKHDWAKAQQMAHDARQGYPVMSNDTYFSGFCSDNNSVMWAQGAEDSDIYYWSWGSHYACNGHYVEVWKVGAMAISLDLYNQLDPNDVRRKMYLTPDKVHEIPDRDNRGKITEADFWDPTLVDGSGKCDMAYGPAARNPQDRDAKWGLQNVIGIYCYNYAKNTFKGDLNGLRDQGADGLNPYYAYVTESTSGQIRLEPGLMGSLTVCPLGSSLKFWAQSPYGTSMLPFMRAGEMALNEAEAAYMAGDEATALKCLKEINDLRIPGYAFNGSGEALLNEIRLCRRIELWGEGFNFSDFKRWNLPMVRRAWAPNDPTSGNYGMNYGINVAPEEKNGWRFIIPFSETRYNNLVNIVDFYK